jgi:peptidoglycan/xylan/chitin deacetylase (PgdA/CDA1 family)
MMDKIRNTVFRLLYTLTGSAQGIRVILLYHSVSREGVGQSYSLSADMLEEQMQLLKRRFNIVRLCELAETMAAVSPKDNLACVTFDDGCLDNYEVALPILECYGIKATFFIVTGLMGRSLRTSCGEVKLMHREHVRELAALGHEVGAHTVSHIRLTSVPLEAARMEIAGSKAVLEDLSGCEVVSFAYPKGEYDERVKAEVSASGFRYAVTVREGLVRQEPDWLALPRVWVSSRLSLHAFAAKVSPAVEWYGWMRGRRS